MTVAEPKEKNGKNSKENRIYFSILDINGLAK